MPISILFLFFFIFCFNPVHSFAEWTPTPIFLFFILFSNPVHYLNSTTTLLIKMSLPFAKRQEMSEVEKALSKIDYKLDEASSIKRHHMKELAYMKREVALRPSHLPLYEKDMRKEEAVIDMWSERELDLLFERSQL
jgi:hypothetical protein